MRKRNRVPFRGRKGTRFLFLQLLITVAIAGCAGKAPPPVTPHATAPPAAAVDRLQRELDALFHARALLQILRQMWQNPAHRDPFFATLPIAGRDGTLEARLHGTRAAGNAHAKTGSLSSVRALSGYVQTAEGETLAFSMLANNFIVPTPSIDAVVDLAVERLANFRR